MVEPFYIEEIVPHNLHEWIIRVCTIKVVVVMYTILYRLTDYYSIITTAIKQLKSLHIIGRHNVCNQWWIVTSNSSTVLKDKFKVFIL